MYLHIKKEKLHKNEGKNRAGCMKYASGLYIPLSQSLNCFPSAFKIMSALMRHANLQPGSTWQEGSLSTSHLPSAIPEPPAETHEGCNSPVSPFTHSTMLFAFVPACCKLWQSRSITVFLSLGTASVPATTHLQQRRLSSNEKLCLCSW